MAKQIKITQDSILQVEAAIAISGELKKLGIDHAFIGGIALFIHRSHRLTQDIDLLADVLPLSIHSYLRPEIAKVNRHFNGVGLKYYFAPSLVGDLEGEQLVFANDRNVLIEALPTKSLGLPSQAGLIILHGDEIEETSVSSNTYKLPILRLSVLILTKLKRWANVYESTRPSFIQKANSDRVDITFLLSWLEDRDLSISFAAYNSQHPSHLDAAVKTYSDYLKANKITSDRDHLEKVITVEDWQRIRFQ